MADMVVARKEGLYCVPGDFYIDPWRPVDRARSSRMRIPIMRASVMVIILPQAPGGQHSRIATRRHQSRNPAVRRNVVMHNGVTISLHPAGHVLGSAQVRMEHRGEVWVASGDYKVEPDGTCAPFEPMRCNAFITESTFGLPIYRWQPQRNFCRHQSMVAPQCRQGRCSVLYCYSFGKAQRILHGIDPSIGPIVCHGAVEPLNRVYRDAGVAFPTRLRYRTSRTNRPINAHSSSRRHRPAAAPGCGASAITAMLSPAAGCSCAAHDAGARWIVASCCPIMPTGRV
jgi:putative mRNA 3-end processing factor